MTLALTLPITLVVLFGALLHASWNALIKSAPDKSLDTALIHVMGTVVALPLLLVAGLPPAASLPYLAASIVIHIGYYIALAGAYKHGDLGLTYPIMRGLAPLLVAMGSGALIGERISILGWAGVAGISAGVLLVGLSRNAWAQSSHRSAVLFALSNAVIIAIYTVVDGLGVRVAVASGGSALQYVAALFLIDGLPYFIIVMSQRSAQHRLDAWGYMRKRWPLALLGTIASLGSYGIALWAMTKAPVAVVAALREVSVLFAALLGAWFLKESFGVQRGVGTLLIVGGVAALRLA
ncbi:MAG: EamA family transporter [Betaproteobacteria bacterium]|nr:EamA family transporter [Betaproteobacteria bacterium]